MDVVSSCPLTVGSVIWQPRPGKWALTFVCKATYELAPAESPLANEQEAPNEDDNYWNDDTTRSLYAASDLVPFKARADVILVGHAFAPRREPTRALVAQLMVGSMTKAIECTCDRMWTLDGQLREGPRFTKIPLRYERAAGGPESSNPVGMRPDVADAYGVAYLPNLLPPGEPIPKRGDVIKPMGFGPIAPSWPTRVEKLGRYAGSWQQHAWNSQALPEDIDPAFFNCAPLDQQISAIRAGERLVLENLHPEHPRLVTSLQTTMPVAIVERAGVAPEEMRLKCDTLWIDTDRSLCTLVWRGRVAIDHPTHAGRITIALEGQTGSRKLAPKAPPVPPPPVGTPAPVPPPPPLGATVPAASQQNLLWNETMQLKAPALRPGKAGAPGAPAHAAAKAPQDEEDETYVVSVDEMDSAGVLPFVKPDGKSPIEASISKPDSRPKPKYDSDEATGWHDTTAVQPHMRATASALPFQAKSQPPRPGQPSVPAFDPMAATPRPVEHRPSQPSVPQFDPAAPRPIEHATPQPPPITPPPIPMMQSTPAPPPLVRPPTTLDPLAPAAVPTSPWAAAARGGPGLGSSIASPPSHIQAPIAPEPSPPQGATFIVKPEPPSPTPMSPAAAAAAATAGAAAASNAAAKGARVGSSPGAAMPLGTGPQAAQAARTATGTREIVTLLWFDPNCAKRLPENPKWDEIIKQPDEDDDEKNEKDGPKSGPTSSRPNNGEDEGLVADEDDEYGSFEEPEPPPPPEDPPEVRDKRNVFKILARGEPKPMAGIHQAVADAIGKDGTLEPPLVLVSGELVFPFDELETLKATVTAVSPLVAGDKKLKEVVDTVNELLKTPWLSRSGSVAEGLTGRIKEAFGQGNRMLPPSYLESHTERVLLEERHYQKRTVFGQPYIRSLFVPASSADPVPAYLPESLSKQLPMFQRLKTRLIAEVHMQQDQYEAQPIALLVVALARVSALPAPPAGGGAGSK